MILTHHGINSLRRGGVLLYHYDTDFTNFDKGTMTDHSLDGDTMQFTVWSGSSSYFSINGGLKFIRARTIQMAGADITAYVRTARRVVVKQTINVSFLQNVGNISWFSTMLHYINCWSSGRGQGVWFVYGTSTDFSEMDVGDYSSFDIPIIAYIKNPGDRYIGMDIEAEVEWNKSTGIIQYKYNGINSGQKTGVFDVANYASYFGAFPFNFYNHSPELTVKRVTVDIYS